jgi:hypothetical protein
MNARHDTQRAPLIGRAAFARMAMAGTDLTPLGQELLRRAAATPDDANTLMDLSSLLLLNGNRTLSLQMQKQALDMEQIYRLPLRGEPALRVLALMAPGDMMANTPIDFLLENSDVELSLLFIGGDFPVPTQLPEHDLLFVAVGESEANLPLLHQLQESLRDWPRPVLNLPALIACLARDEVHARLHDVPGIALPRTLRIDRDTLERLATGALTPTAILGDDFPLIVRPLDSHAGIGLERLETPAAVAAYLAGASAPEFFVSRFVDYRSGDGLFRKYRIALIGGKPYLAHLAISDHWMIHYLNAGMADSADKRAEEAYAMQRFERDFARRHQQALDAVYQRMGLDYLGIDCAETRDGELLIFEVDTSMVIHDMDPADLYPYKQPQMRKVFAAFRELLLATARPHPITHEDHP